MLSFILLIVITILATNSSAAGSNSALDETTLQWTTAKFDFPCSSTKSLFKSSGKLRAQNVIATRAQMLGKKLFFAMPRYRSGVAATLVTTEFKPGTCSLIFQAYPCWDMQEEGDCKALQSVVDLVIDQNEILWVLDTGVTETLEKPTRHCAAKVVALSTKTGKVLKTISLKGLTNQNSRLQYLLVDYAEDGACYVYISDAANRIIIVYNLQADHGLRVVLPKAISGTNRARDVLYIALIRRDYADTELYFTYLSAPKIYSLRTEYLRSGYVDGRIIDVGKKTKPIVIIGTDNGSSMLLRNEGGSEVYSWDTNTTFIETNLRLVHRSPMCQLATHAITDYTDNTMRVLQSSFPDFMLNRVGCGATQQLALLKAC